MPEGHLFVVHGRIQSVIHDAAIVPVDTWFDFNSIWDELVGKSPDRPADWDTRQWGRIGNAPDRVWAISTGDGAADDYDAVAERVVAAIARISERREQRAPVRGDGTLPLVALPVVGIGRGGYSRDRGKVLVALVKRLQTAAREHNIDIALVTPDPAVFAAAQYARRDFTTVLPDDLETAARALGEGARRGELALFLGAGVSVAAGLPGWHHLIAQLAEEVGVRKLENPQAPLTAVDQAELIEKSHPTGFRRRVAEITSTVRRPSLLHGLLAGLDCREVITTNYDTLYEDAVGASDRDIASVMPWSSAHGAERWVLKLHGDVNYPDSIVLTRRHMVTYDAANRPSGALLQSLLLTKRLLIVGVSMTDDNVIRLAHEVQQYRNDHQGPGSGTFGTVLDAAGDELRRQLWDGQFDWISLPDAGTWTGPRGVELFLDRVAFHGARNSSWLLDPRFEGLLDNPEDSAIAEDVRRLYHRLPRREGTKWWPLVRRLDDLGANPQS